MKTRFRLLAFLSVAPLTLGQAAAGEPYLRLPPDYPCVLTEWKDGNITNAPPEDLVLAKTYYAFTNKGPVTENQRLTILTHKTRFKVGEPVRVLHVYETLNPDITVFPMGPKTIVEEYGDGKLTPCQGPLSYCLRTMVITDLVMADFNYSITIYTFNEPGTHTVKWKGTDKDLQKLKGLESNLITLEVVKE